MRIVPVCSGIDAEKISPAYAAAETMINAFFPFFDIFVSS
jgi:hypothetical protein